MTMTKKTRYEVYVLAALVVVLLVFLFYAQRSHESVFTGVHADDGKFEPLNVPDPSLRIDLLAGIQKEHYNGQHRNIFSEVPLPPPPAVAAQEQAAEQRASAPPPPPPLTVPATFYGIVTEPATGQSRACFSSDGNVYILPVGGILLHQFRVMKVGSNSVELQEISSGRTTALILPLTASPQEAQP